MTYQLPNNARNREHREPEMYWPIEVGFVANREKTLSMLRLKNQQQTINRNGFALTGEPVC